MDLEQAPGYLRCILKNSGDLIFAADTDGRLLFLSAAGEKLLGRTGDAAAGTPVKDLADDPAALEGLIEACMEQGRAVHGEVAFRGRDGVPVHCDVALDRLEDAEGRPAGVVGVCRDITSWKKLQEDLILVDRLAEIGRIASGVAHEINNPLAVISEISGWVGVVVSDAGGLSEEDREELETAVRRIGEQTDRCKAITRQVLGFARDTRPSTATLDIHQLLSQTIEFLKPELKVKNIRLVQRFVEGVLEVRSDAKMLEQVFVNLLSNALYAIKEKGDSKGRIELKTVKREGMVEVSVSDTGTGIPKQEREKIFGLFYTTKPPGKGTGLGLPICRNILKKLGGDISFESEPGVGTTFTVRVPVSGNPTAIS